MNYPQWQASHKYKMNEKVYVSAERRKILVCIKEGTSGTAYPVIRSNGAKVIDGTVTWGTYNLEGAW